MDACNGVLLQLFECIESLKCEVKKKMKVEGSRSRGTKVTQHFARENYGMIGR
jgi:hypothetical protein